MVVQNTAGKMILGLSYREDISSEDLAAKIPYENQPLLSFENPFSI